ncbi:MAG TPA: hypothetical protein VGL91_19340 [Acidobacteriota bacterium]
MDQALKEIVEAAGYPPKYRWLKDKRSKFKEGDFQYTLEIHIGDKSWEVPFLKTDLDAAASENSLTKRQEIKDRLKQAVEQLKQQK